MATQRRTTERASKAEEIQATTSQRARRRGAIAMGRRIDPHTPIPSVPPAALAGTEETGKVGVSVVTPGRRYYARLTRYNPLRQFKPETVALQCDAFKNGILREYALLMEAVAKRDDVLTSVIPKRKAEVKRLRRTIQIAEDCPKSKRAFAEQQQSALRYFYDNLTTTSAIDANAQGGWLMLIDQMMDALGYVYAVHEIMWQPSTAGLTARMNYVPLWFFENRTGKLRFLPHDFAPYGDDLEDRAWLVTTGPGLMEPSVTAAMFKNMSFRDWLIYNEKHAMPGVHGQTSAPYKSPQWIALEQAVASMSQDFSCVTGTSDKIEKIDLSKVGELPYEPLVERMDRALSWIWRGGSMSTTGGASAGPEQFGANMQDDEAGNMCEDDCLWLTETLQKQIDPIVLEWTFGAGVEVLAHVQVAPEKRQDVDKDIKVLDFLHGKGVELGKNQLRELFKVPTPDQQDDLVQSALERQLETQASFGMFGWEGDQAKGNRFEANERLGADAERKLLQTAHEAMVRSTHTALHPLREQVEAVLDQPNEQAMMAALRKLRRGLPATLRQINRNPENAETLHEAMVAGWFNGLAAGVARSN